MTNAEVLIQERLKQTKNPKEKRFLKNLLRELRYYFSPQNTLINRDTYEETQALAKKATIAIEMVTRSAKNAHYRDLAVLILVQVINAYTMSGLKEYPLMQEALKLIDEIRAQMDVVKK